LSGVTTDPDTYDRILAAFPDGLPGALEGKADIRLQPLFLAVADLMPIVQSRADCGPLQLVGATSVGYGPDSPVTITGPVAETATRIGIYDALRVVVGERKVILDVEVLNPTLCLIENRLPDAPKSDIGVSFSFGVGGDANPSGRFFVGENPVIDVTLPPQVTDGYLTVSILDVSGNVFHLLPNITREDNQVASLRNGQTGPTSVRVAYSLQESASNGLLAFRVDDSALGKSKVIVLLSEKPLFDGLRPTSESAEGYARALQEYADSDLYSILSLDSRILITARP